MIKKFFFAYMIIVLTCMNHVLIRGSIRRSIASGQQRLAIAPQYRFFIDAIQNNIDALKNDIEIAKRAGTLNSFWYADGLHRNVTALTFALGYPQTSIEVIRTLLENGVDPNIPDEKGVYPLEFAVMIPMHGKKVVELLLNYGANPNIPSRYFRRYNFRPTQEVLESLEKSEGRREPSLTEMIDSNVEDENYKNEIKKLLRLYIPHSEASIPKDKFDMNLTMLLQYLETALHNLESILQ